ncbi:hypothetical protein AB0G60_12910 [Streptomyces angustmyceticus]|uniref:Uncharacterized protein n=1 Tax=Streptomyces angustmyceticus TaxID=285578 RepID=A0A5J4LHU9_9ACTN|nr:hypothetical protein [Streptomyces angustmyceticus]UAL67419.1 hypothetical protein K7396_13425 [Streptomyces angustmyceticus]GES31150.1 hypothetical protein San01_36370 [Streptomyces angustmyceticus]
MSPSTSALIVAVVGVAGTLLSGVLAHRSTLRSKSMELGHEEQQRCEERLAEERREALNERRASYAALNQHLRHFHQALSRHFLVLEAGHASAQQTQAREESRRNLREVYAEAQMTVPDDVLTSGGNLVHQLHRIHVLLSQHEQEATTDEPLSDIKERLERASESLYEVRQTMRRDLGITELPIRRPDGYGAT